jgi:ABC-type uncharacterized transport system ATPase subunit
MSEIRAKTLGSRKWIVKYDVPVTVEQLTAIDDIDHAEADESGAWNVLCAGDADLNRVVAHLASVGALTDLTTSDITLHDIFIQKFSA